MKKISLLIIVVVFFSISLLAQKATDSSRLTTAYPQFKPAIITLETGKVIEKEAVNVFMANGALLYKHGKTTMRAEMKNVKKVDFADRTYLKVDTILAYIVDTLKDNKLLCATLIDLEAYKSEILNNKQITNLELGSYVNVSTMDLSDINEYPLVNYYYYELNGEIIKVHERTITKKISKNKRTQLNTLMQAPDFSWDDIKWLMRVLKIMT